MGHNMLVDGEWEQQFEPSTNEDGTFKRQESIFRKRIGDDFPVEEDRYHLYISRACPWAHGAVLAKTLLGLDAITVDIVDPYREEKGWQFTPEKDGCTNDRVTGYDYLYEAYQHADEEFTGRVTVPLLWDKKQNTAVNNESIEIMRMFAQAFETGNELYPEAMQDSIDEVIAELYDTINNAVYEAGFATTQEAYKTAVEKLFGALDRYNDRLSDRRFLVGEQVTLADIRLYATLIRFDPVYHTHFKCNVKRISDYDHLNGFMKDIYQLPGVAATVNMEHIKEHYYRTHPSINPKGIIARGPSLDLDSSHGRETLPGILQ